MNTPSRIQKLIENIVPWLILGILATFTYAKFVVVPYIGFGFSNGEIIEIFVPTPNSNIQVGDRAIRFDQYPIDKLQENMYFNIFKNMKSGDTISLMLERDGEIIETNWLVPGPDKVQLLERFNGIWWLTYVFWMSGTATLLFIRPKDTRWKLFLAFNYLTAIWLAAGSGPSQWHIWNSTIILHSAIWLCLPVYIHFHWEFPNQLKRIPKAVWVIFYILGFVAALSEWFHLIPPTTYSTGFVIALVCSVLLLLSHAIFQREYRRDLAILGFTVVLILLPIIGYALFASFFVAFSGGALLTLPALPGAYFFIAYRRQFQSHRSRFRRLILAYIALIVISISLITILSLIYTISGKSESNLAIGTSITFVSAVNALIGFFPFLTLPALVGETISFSKNRDLNIRANRLLSLYLFIVLVGAILVIGSIITDGLIDFTEDSTIIGILATLSGIVITALGFSSFQHFIDRRMLGIQLPSQDLLRLYADRITTSLERNHLVSLLRDELLPSLLIRQSVLLQVEAEVIKSFMIMGVDKNQIPSAADTTLLMELTGKFLGGINKLKEPLSWVRLVLPLQMNEKTIGLWLFGLRDPDDIYTFADINLLEILANQTAIALVNIEQADQLRELYQANIERQEVERKALARYLHDDVLNQLAMLPIQIDPYENPYFHEQYHLVANRLRQMVTDLRPAMLNYGLWTALEEFIDQLSERIENRPPVVLEYPDSLIRFDPAVEEHLFRIVQQACENAVRHAQANHINVIGRHTNGWIQLSVLDDGVGIQDIEPIDFNTLLTNRKFGLAGMFERAHLIGAELQIDSKPGDGTRVKLSWQASASVPEDNPTD